MTPLWAVQDFAVGFLSYVLPWGQMSFWLATAVTSPLGPEATAALWSAGPAPPAVLVGARMLGLLFLGG